MSLFAKIIYGFCGVIGVFVLLIVHDVRVSMSTAALVEKVTDGDFAQAVELSASMEVDVVQVQQ